jgi:hypothetical protein
VRFLRRRQQEQRPEPVDQAGEWVEVLSRYRTRGSRPLNLELYKREQREQRRAEAAIASLRGGAPLATKESERATPGALDRPHPMPPDPNQNDFGLQSEPAPPAFDPLAPDAPEYDETEAGVLRRRYGAEVPGSTWRWA